MQIGLTVLPSDLGLPPSNLAKAAEDRGFSALLFGEHSHVPVSRDSAFPAGGDVPEKYRRTLDPFVSLGAAVEATSTIAVGTGICLVAQRDPILTAKALATIDVLSNGRLIFGIGFGWNREEMSNHGVDFESRREITAEKLAAILRLWSDDVAGYEGNHVRFSASWCGPQAVQRPSPPILVGGSAKATRLFAAEHGYTWFPTVRSVDDARMVCSVGREMLSGSQAQCAIQPLLAVPDREQLRVCEDHGIERVFILLERAGMSESSPDTTSAELDEFATWNR